MTNQLHFEVIGRTWDGRRAYSQYTKEGDVPFWPRG